MYNQEIELTNSNANPERIKSFLQKLIEKTKKGKLTWDTSGPLQLHLKNCNLIVGWESYKTKEIKLIIRIEKRRKVKYYSIMYPFQQELEELLIAAKEPKFIKPNELLEDLETELDEY